MLDIKFIRENKSAVKDSVTIRGAAVDIDELLNLDKKRLDLLKDAETLRSQLKISGKPDKSQLKKLQTIKNQFAKKEAALHEITDRWKELLSAVPNVVAPDTPRGGEKANHVVKNWGRTDQFDFQAKDHLQLNIDQKLFDLEAGAKAAGNKFYYLKHRLVKLEMALVSMALEYLEKEGFEFLAVPHLVNTNVARGTGFLPRGEERQIYEIQGHNLHLIATAEMPLTAYHMDEIIDLTQPKLYASLSPCYRVEAGAYGKFAKGLYRVHQFDKLEMYVFCQPKVAEKQLHKLIGLEEKICQLLEIPYRLVRIASAELSAPAYEKYDLEYWSPADNNYRELTSCSNCTDFQARRLNVRYRDESSQLYYANTLNGTVLTSSRTIIALLENHQKADGSIVIPKALQPYYGSKILWSDSTLLGVTTLLTKILKFISPKN